MMLTNLTILYLSVSSLTSSPYSIIQPKAYSNKFEIRNSYLHNFVSNFLYTETEQHETRIFNTKFQNFMSTALSFGSDYYQFSKSCPLTNEDTVKNCYYNSSLYGTNQEARPYFVGNPSTLIIAGCLFDQLHDWQKTTNPNLRRGGGALYICEKAHVTLHENIFHFCGSDFDGGAVFAVNDPSFSNDRIDLKNGQIETADVQYCCFSKCYCYNDIKKCEGFGSAMYVAANNATLLFAGTIDCVNPDNEQHGAQFDIQSGQLVSSSNVNITKANAKYCGGIEYRYATSGYFRYQTMIELNCRYGTSFSGVNIDGVEISNCNYFNNTLKTKIDTEPDPALIHIRDKNIKLREFYFVDTHFSDSNGRFGSKNTNVPTITFINCYFEDSTEKWRTNDCQLSSCTFVPKEEMTTCGIAQLNLYHCQGNHTANTLIITSLFTPSNAFTKSQSFTKSNTFKKTQEFSNSIEFTRSYAFTSSNVFTLSSKFSKSDVFSESKSFTKSNYFSKSDLFSASQKFDSTEVFTFSKIFTKSESFTKSKEFTKSQGFSTSSLFTKSNAFDASKTFTLSNLFTQSDGFTSSSIFSRSNAFSKSNVFSSSKIFSSSYVFTNSNPFDATATFTPSNSFSSSQLFTKSNPFTKSNKFTPSNSFVETLVFTKSNKFTVSSKFTQSNKFPSSSSFTPSNIFTKSSKFTTSRAFDATSTFTSSETFSFSSTFTSSEMFTDSNTFKIVPVIDIDDHEINQNNGNTSKTIKTIAIATSLGAGVAVIVGVVAYKVFRKKPILSSDNQIIELKSTNEMQTNENPLFDLLDESDPFGEDFHDNEFTSK